MNDAELQSILERCKRATAGDPRMVSNEQARAWYCVDLPAVIAELMEARGLLMSAARAHGVVSGKWMSRTRDFLGGGKTT
jgi:hypothetical protein